MPIDKPNAGDATRKTLIDAIIDELTDHENIIGSVRNLAVPNASFENDSDSDGYPDGWSFTQYTGGSFSLQTTTVSHGLKAARIVSASSGGTNGGGYLESTDFIEATQRMIYRLDWELISSAATVRNIVAVRFYDSTQTFISAVTLYDNQTNNPTSAFTRQTGIAVAPTATRFLKIRLTGGFQGTPAAGSAYFDNIVLRSIFRNERYEEYTSAGTYRLKTPSDTWGAWCELVGGGGGGGGSSSSDGGAGGGGGGRVRGWLSLTPNTVYTLVVGAGGAGSSGGGGSGTSGTATTFSTLSAGGGTGGAQASGGGATGGAGGVAVGGDIFEDGSAGSDGAAAGNGGDGGKAPGTLGAGGAGATSGSTAGGAGALWGAGGGGAKNQTGGAGSSGRARFWF